jgi:2-phospho-L-lactate guanylyltransferase
MKIWAIVPVKSLNRAKSRLSSILTGSERKQLALRMLRYNLETVSGSGLLSGVLVISRDSDVLHTAQSIDDVIALQEIGVPHLNNALEQARNLLMDWGADAVLVLPADIPFITGDDLRAMLEMGRQPGTVVIAPDRHGQGTNAILLHPPEIIDFSFGVGSYERHQMAARTNGAQVFSYQSEGLALDIDTPDDMLIWQDKLGIR